MNKHSISICSLLLKEYYMSLWFAVFFLKKITKNKQTTLPKNPQQNKKQKTHKQKIKTKTNNTNPEKNTKKTPQQQQNSPMILKLRGSVLINMPINTQLHLVRNPCLCHWSLTIWTQYRDQSSSRPERHSYKPRSLKCQHRSCKPLTMTENKQS